MEKHSVTDYTIIEKEVRVIKCTRECNLCEEGNYILKMELNESTQQPRKYYKCNHCEHAFDWSGPAMLDIKYEEIE